MSAKRPMPESALPIGADVIRAAVDAVAELDEKGDAYIAEVLETESWEEHVAEAAIRAALDKLGLREERTWPDPSLRGKVRPSVRFVTDWRIADWPSATNEGEPRG